MPTFSQIERNRITRGLHLGVHTAESALRSQFSAFRRFSDITNLHNLYAALVDYWSVRKHVDTTPVNYSQLLKLFAAKTHHERAQIFCDFIETSYHDMEACNMAFGAMLNSF